jgi:outer membrane protein assembly factor BamB
MKTSLPQWSLTVIWLAASLLAAHADDWPQWRGPNRDDISKEKGLLKSWPEGGPKRVWLYTNGGNSYSGPAIVSGKLYTMGTRDNAEVLLTLDANTGKELWTAPLGRILVRKILQRPIDLPKSLPIVAPD